MKLQVLGSDSKGNSYVLQNSREALIIEAGVNISDIKKALSWQTNKVVGAIISHEHNDHSKSIKELMNLGITVLALPEVFRAKKISNLSFRKEIEPMKGYKVGGFQILTFPVNHDVPCLGFLVSHKDMGKLLFVTDTSSFDYSVTADHIMIEANYATDIVQRKIDEGSLPTVILPRLFGSHMEISETIRTVQALDLTTTSNIILIHLSNGNSDENRFVRDMKQATGKPVYVAAKGVEIDLSLNPY